jgi:hypothetical protein
LGQEKGLCQDTAADYKILFVVRLDSPVLCDACSHFSERPRPIRFSKRFPRKRAWHRIGVREDPASNNEIIGGVELKKKKLSRL